MLLGRDDGGENGCMSSVTKSKISGVPFAAGGGSRVQIVVLRLEEALTNQWILGMDGMNRRWDRESTDERLGDASATNVMNETVRVGPVHWVEDTAGLVNDRRITRRNSSGG